MYMFGGDDGGIEMRYQLDYVLVLRNRLVVVSVLDGLKPRC